MAVEVVLSLDKEIDSAIKANGWKRKSAYKLEFLEELTEAVSKSILGGADQIQLLRSMNKVFKKFEDQTKDALKDEISRKSGVAWSATSGLESVNGSYNQTVQKSYNHSKDVMRNKAMTLHRRNKALQKNLSKGYIGQLERMGIKAATEREARKEIASQIVDLISEGLGKTMTSQERLLVDTEVRRLKFQESVKANPKEAVMWITNPTERTCPYCWSRNGRVYPEYKDADPQPAHPNCNCEYQFLDSTLNK